MSRSSAVGVLLAVLLAGCQAGAARPATEFTSSALAAPMTGKTCHATHAVLSDPEAWLPDIRCTPGKANPAVTLGQLCPHVAPELKRPNLSALKQRQLAAYDYMDDAGDHPQTLASTEEDHLISRQLGGDLSAPGNLWPEPGTSPNRKDAVERAAHDAVCSGRLTLPQAQQGIAANWVDFGRRLGVKFA